MTGSKKHDLDTYMAKKKVYRIKNLKMTNIKIFFLGLFIIGIMFLQAYSAQAEGTPASTNITNQATVNYTVGTVSFTLNSNVATTSVDELIDVSVVWQDSAYVTVTPGDTNQVLIFRVTNTGNGTETFTLTADSTVGGGEYNPSFVGLYLDTNGNGLYNAGVDLQYVPTANDPMLTADASITVFVLNDIPGGISDGDRGNSQLTATSVTGTGAPGTAFANAGEGGTDAVLGASGGSAGETGTYLVSTVTVSVVKSAQIADPLGGTNPVTGAVITYSLVVTVTGSGTAETVVITDAIPANTTYRSNTLTLNSASLTDGADGDAGDIGVSTPGVVTVVVGDLSAASSVQTITFDVIIN
jgi:uncharacterized repeat protein (TIGR01451 family)